MQALEISLEHDHDQVIANLWEAGTLGVIEKATIVEAFFSDAAELSNLLAIYGKRATILRFEEAAAEPPPDSQQLDPVLAGEKFFIVPPSSPAPTPPGRIRLEINAQNAFGSGSHETTLLVIRAMELHLSSGATVLDIGSGSGVLSAAALALGAVRVFACDTHLDATRLTHLHAPEASIFAGSIDSVRTSAVDLAVANISARVIDRISFHLARIVKPGGLIILSGFIGASTPAAFLPDTETSLQDWLCWVCKPALAPNFQSTPSTGNLQPFEQEWW